MKETTARKVEMKDWKLIKETEEAFWFKNSKTGEILSVPKD